jgi:hypothetical protein
MQPSAPARHFDGIRCGPREGSRSLSRESASMVSAYAAGRSWLRHRLHDETALIRQKGSCVAVVLPENAYLGTSGIDWECSRGFHSVGSRCQLTAVPENAYDCASQYGRGWECTRGHRASAASCEIIKVPMRINRAITPKHLATFVQRSVGTTGGIDPSEVALPFMHQVFRQPVRILSWADSLSRGIFWVLCIGIETPHLAVFFASKCLLPPDGTGERAH